MGRQCLAPSASPQLASEWGPSCMRWKAKPRSWVSRQEGGPSEVSGRADAILSVGRVRLRVTPQGLSRDLWVPVAGSESWSPGVTVVSFWEPGLDVLMAGPSACPPASKPQLGQHWGSRRPRFQ